MSAECESKSYTDLPKACRAVRLAAFTRPYGTRPTVWSRDSVTSLEVDDAAYLFVIFKHFDLVGDLINSLVA